VKLRYAPYYGHKPSGAVLYNGLTTTVPADGATGSLALSGAGAMVATALGAGTGTISFSGAAIMVMGLRATGVGSMAFSGQATAWFVPPYCVVVTPGRAKPRVTVAGRSSLLVSTAGHTPYRVGVAGRARPLVAVKSGELPC